MDTLRIPGKCAREMIEHARKDAPNECCGLLAGSDGMVHRVYPAVNIDRSPVRYTIDPRDMTRIFKDAEEEGLDILAFYHSHTATEAYPSPTDVKLAPPSDMFDYQYVIVSLADRENPVVRCFRIVDRKIHESKVEIVA